ncbi:MAG: hypothetical protein K2X66_00750, partial [Cyanobacteria bacterium]|nr:hypothetical protein [Cyanobacteriota bacterium]
MLSQPTGLCTTKPTVPSVKNPFAAQLIPYYWKKNSTIQNISFSQKQPLILVHGLNGETVKLFHWKDFLRAAENKPGFQERYQVYLYRYDSRQSLEALGAEFQQHLKPLIESPNPLPLEILAYSQGGLISRIALKNPEICSHTDKVISLATPFHGSPLANPSWLRRQLQSLQSFSVIKFTQRIAYWVTGRLYPEFEADFHWDNFDQALKFEDESKFYTPEESQSVMAPYQNK